MEPQKDNKSPVINAQNKQAVELFFRDNESLLYVYKKTERIVSALHLVTNLLHEDEPLRNVIRERALTLLGSLLTYKDIQKNPPISDFAMIISCLGVARDAGFISSMNYDIVAQEIEAIVGLLNKYQEKTGRQLYFGESFFHVNLPVPHIEQMSQGAPVKDILYKGQSSVLYTKSSKMAPVNAVKTDDVLRDTKSDRRQKILDIVKQKGVCSIKDFSYVITDFSEKTLQRELGAMVAEGVLKKEGEKRWSTYRLVG